MSEDRFDRNSTTKVSARKYRPGRFSEVLAQDHVSRTLENAISQGRLSHAYLFTGPRGVGKTTMARILAKAVNCERPLGAEPCDECSMCEEIRQGHALDVIEIDGASNRRIADIRDLRQKVGFAPSRANRKVYIIDEVHMLTNEAFNALLKTLEEPPEKVIFIFATTEPHKVPLTITSRCQRFDFRSISRGEIAEYLDWVAKKEGVLLKPETRYAVARKADGSLRDALSIFDQMRAFASGEFDEKDIITVTGMLKDELFIDLFNRIASCDGEGLISLLTEIADSGPDLGEVYDCILEHLRNLIVLKVDESLKETCDVPESALEWYLKLVPMFGVGELLDMFDYLSSNRALYRNSELKKILLETILLRFVMNRHHRDTGCREDSASSAESLEKPQARAQQPARKNERERGTRESQPQRGTRESQPQRGTRESQPQRGTRESELEQGIPENDIWKKFMELLSKKKATLYGLLSSARPLGLEKDTFTVETVCGNSFLVEQLKLPDHIAILNDCLSEVCGRQVHINVLQEDRKKNSSQPEPSRVVDRLKKILEAEEITRESQK